MSDSWRSHGLQYARLPCPSLSPGIFSVSCPLCWWCHPSTLPSVTHFSSCLQSFPASGPFLVSQFFTSGGPSIGASAPVLPMNIQGWFPSGLTGLIFLQSKGLWRVFSSYHSSKASILWCSAFFVVQISHPYMTTEKTIALTMWTFISNVMFLLFNIV